MGQRVNLGRLVPVPIDPAEAGEGVDTVNVHRTRSTDSFSARSSERQRRVDLVLDLDQSIEN